MFYIYSFLFIFSFRCVGILGTVASSFLQFHSFSYYQFLLKNWFSFLYTLQYFINLASWYFLLLLSILITYYFLLFLVIFTYSLTREIYNTKPYKKYTHSLSILSFQPFIFFSSLFLFSYHFSLRSFRSGPDIRDWSYLYFRFLILSILCRPDISGCVSS